LAVVGIRRDIGSQLIAAPVGDRRVAEQRRVNARSA
jgi:hypothetical protein